MVKDEIREIIIEMLKSEGETEQEITDDTQFIEELAFDSIRFITLIVKVEEKFDITLEEDALLFDTNSTVKGLCGYVERALSNRS